MVVVDWEQRRACRDRGSGKGDVRGKNAGDGGSLKDHVRVGLSMSSPTPLIFKRSGNAKSQQRARQTSLEPESNDNDSTAADTAEDSPSTLASKLKSKAKKSRTKSRLSFGAAEEEVRRLYVFIQSSVL